jgi:hypothetical protein
MSAGTRDREGFTLASVLVLCIILIPVCASLAQASRNLAVVSSRDLTEAKLEFLAGGIADTLAWTLTSNRNLFDQLNGRWATCTLGETLVAISIRDHDGTIDLNNASSELLIEGFRAAGLQDEMARLLQQYVEASRSNGQVPRAISALTAKVSLKRAPFEHVDELKDVLAALDSPAIELDPLFTVETGVAGVETATATPALRARLSGRTDRGVLLGDNGGFDHIDVVLYLRSRSGEKPVGLSKTYRKISSIGDVVTMRRKRLRAEWPPTDEHPQSGCLGFLGVEGEG